MPWVETRSPHFTARHDTADDRDVLAVLELLEGTRGRLVAALGAVPEDVAVVVHPSRAQLWAAQPQVAVAGRLTAPAARRYLTGWAGRRTLHVLAPRIVRARASGVPGSREMVRLAPAALLGQLAAAHVRPGLGRRPGWWWLLAGAGQWLSGQTTHARPAIARRLHEGRPPAFPPGMRDALLLGGSVLDLVARREGDEAAAALVRTAASRRTRPRAAVAAALPGLGPAEVEGAWRAHLARLATPGRRGEARRPA